MAYLKIKRTLNDCKSNNDNNNNNNNSGQGTCEPLEKVDKANFHCYASVDIVCPRTGNCLSVPKAVSPALIGRTAYT